MNADLNSFTVRVWEGEYLRARLSGEIVTVSYDAGEFIRDRVSPGDYIEAEGSYDPTSNVLTAHEVEFEYGPDDD